MWLCDKFNCVSPTRIEALLAKGLRHAREINRAHILATLDRGIPESHVMAVRGNEHM